MVGEIEIHPRVQYLLKRPQVQQRSPEWYVIRKGLVTASEVASVLDIKPFASFQGSPRALLLQEKRRPLGEGIDNVFTRHGQKYEDEARDIYCDMTGELAYEFGLMVHEHYPWLGASVDGVTNTGLVLEIKCPLSRKIEPGSVPHHYMPQVQICLEVCDLEEARFIQYKPEAITWPRESEFDVAVVKRDREWFQAVLPALKAFHEEMTSQVPAPPNEPVVVGPPEEDKPPKISKKMAPKTCFIDVDSHEEEEVQDPPL
jgi:putative phage-type endonuclease